MRIAYSCAGEGLGHATRMTVIGPLLEEAHELVYFVPATIRGFVAGRMRKAELERIAHFAFKKRGEKIRLLASFLSALPLAVAFPFEICRLSKRLKELRIDAVISDFDPFLSWAARMTNIPIFQINHPGVVQRVLRPHLGSWISSLGSLLLEGPWNERIHISFYHGDVGPILRREIFKYPVKDGGFVLLNLKECFRPVVLPILASMGIRYHLFPNPNEVFEEALASCSCVLSSAGHQIIAESIALDKPIMVIPQRGQWEQALNAEMVQKTGRGVSTTVEALRDDLPRFLAELRSFRSKPVPSGFNVTDNTQVIKNRIEAFLQRCRERKYRWVLVPQGIRY